MNQRTEQLIKNFMLLTEEQKKLVEQLILAFIAINTDKNIAAI